MEVIKGVSMSDAAAAGAVAGCLTRALLSPIDILKIRFQLQLEPIKYDTVSKYSGIWQAVKMIYQEEGLKAFWKGHVPAQALSIVYGAVQFATFEATRKGALKLFPSLCDNPVYTSALNTCCGGVAGVSATFTCHPFDVLRTRLVGQGEPKLYNGVVHAVREMYKENGMHTFYKGLVPTLTQIAPYMALQFGMYTTSVAVWRKLSGEETRRNSTVLFLAGMLAGLCSKTIVLPFDLVKKRLQVIGFHDARMPFGRTQVYSGMIHCFIVVCKEEGMLGFYKGASVALIKASLVSAVNFWLYEQTMKILQKRRG